MVLVILADHFALEDQYFLVVLVVLVILLVLVDHLVQEVLDFR